MSRIGSKPILLNDKVKVNVKDKDVTVTGSRGELSHVIPNSINVEIIENRITVTVADESRKTKALHGLTRSLLANMVKGVDSGFQKELLINGVGYRAQVSGKKLVINVGYSHPVEYKVPDDVKITVADNTKITVDGIDKQRVGQVSATIRQFRKPEPYKGKGIRYADEYIRMKEGKTV